MNYDAEKIGSRVKQIRAKAGETQDAVAELLQLEKASISRKERGKTVFSVEELLTLAQRYGVSLDWLVTGEVPSDHQHYPKTEKNLISCYQALNDEDRMHIYNMCVEMAMVSLSRA